MALQRCSVIEHWLCTGPHLSCMLALLPLMSLLSVHSLQVVNAVMCSLKSTPRSRAVRIWTINIGFDPAADSIRIRSIKIGFDPIYQDRIWSEFSTRIDSNLSHYTCQPTLACTPVKNWRIFWIVKFYCRHTLADSNWCIPEARVLLGDVIYTVSIPQELSVKT